MRKKSTYGRSVNRAELADIFGVAVTTIDIWIRAGCPVMSRGGMGKPWAFNTADVAQWRRDTARDDEGPGLRDADELKIREIAARVALSELEYAEKKKLVIPAEDVQRTLSQVFAEVRASMRNIPRRVTSTLVGETDERRIRDALTKEIDQALEALAESGFEMCVTEGDDNED